MATLRPTALVLAASVAATALLVGCGGSMVAKKPKSPAINDAITTMWTGEVVRVARTGDWLLTRSYSGTGDAIVFAGMGEELSHSSIYDAERGTIIEATSSGVHEVPLENLIARNRIVMVVRPRSLTAQQRRASVERARTTLGKKYDYSGVFGIDSSDRFYCTELLLWAAGIDRPAIITPASLLEYGPVIYYSGKRDDPQMIDVAMRRSGMARVRTATSGR